MEERTFAAVDLGASGGRVVAGTVDDEGVRLRAVHRFPNRAVRRAGHLRWDIHRLYQEIIRGLHSVPEAESIGLDTWGVDYGLLDSDGRLVADPVSHRDNRTSAVIDQVHARIDPAELYRINGLQHLPFNTIYQLAADQRGPDWALARRAVLLPDLVAYWLTGQLRSEATVASTTGLLDVNTRDWSDDLFHRLDLEPGLLPPVESPGCVRGRSHAGIPVVTVAAHDTASAVVAVPATTDRFAFVSCGTWSLVGLELPHPILSEAARESGFTNEMGTDGRTRFLRNVGGLWLIQECLRTWGRDDLPALLSEATVLPSGGPQIDVDDPTFVPPGDMPGRVAQAAGVRLGSLSQAETVRCIVESLAAGFARTIQRGSALAHRPVEIIHLVGGGAHNQLLCQLTADAVGAPVIAGPVEATALGNVLVQARTAGALPQTLEELRARTANAVDLRRYDPS